MEDKKSLATTKKSNLKFTCFCRTQTSQKLGIRQTLFWQGMHHLNLSVDVNVDEVSKLCKVAAKDLTNVMSLSGT